MTQNSEDVAKAIEGEVVEHLALENELAVLEQQLSENEVFRNFLAKQKQIQQQLADFWKRVETEMIDLNIKTIKGDWGSLTIAERTDLKADEANLAPRFFKRVPDTKRIKAAYELEGKLPKGVTLSTAKYLTKRFKDKG